jgi:hypothetical protein
MTVVIAAVALLTVFGLPAVRAFIDSFESQAGARAMIGAALASARAIAAREQHYVGIRFQKAYHREGPLKAAQYMIFIIHDQPSTNLANGFRAVEGVKPIRLPDSFGVMDLTVVHRTVLANNHVECRDDPIDMDSEIDEPAEVNDTTTFSVIFSPSGKLVTHDVRVRNRDGIKQPRNLNDSRDGVFNSTKNIIDNKTGMFIQDEYFRGSPPDLGYGPERSRNSFIIYDRVKFKEAYQRGRPYRDYLEDLEGSMIYINPYTGTLINR